MTVVGKALSKEDLLRIVEGVIEDCGYIGKLNGNDFLVLSSPEQEDEIEKLAGMRMYDVMRELKMEYGFDDEYNTCGRCGEIIHTGDYGLPDYIIYDYDYVCGECIEVDMLLDSDQESPYVNNPRKALFSDLISKADLVDEGFILLDGDYENGWYGVEDDPQTIYNKLEDKYEEIVFYITSCNPFTTEFQVFVRGEM